MESASLKKAQRQQTRAKRRELAIGFQQQASHQLARIMTNHPYFLNARQIAAYYPFEGEISPLAILQQAEKSNKKVFLPILDPIRDRGLLFLPYSQQTHLQPNRWGILEPQVPIHQAIAPWTLSLLLLPMVNFDQTGKRLGMGGGYYDRLCDILINHYAHNRPQLVGLAYDFQELERVPCDHWDITVDAIATESQIRIIRPHN